MARDTFSNLVELQCVFPLEVAAARAQQRLALGKDASEADAEIVHSIAAPMGPLAGRSTDQRPRRAG